MGSSMHTRHRQCSASPDRHMYYCNFPGCVYEGFNDYQELVKHWNQYCQAYLLVCNKCDTKVRRKDVSQHVCVKSLRTDVQKLKTEIGELKGLIKEV